MTREELEKRIDELARKYVETRDAEIIDELYNLRLELKRLDGRKPQGAFAPGNGKARR